MDILVTIHSALRWVVLILLLVAIFRAFSGWTGKKPYTAGDRKLGLFSVISLHLQFVIGMILYFTSDFVRTDDMGAAMKDRVLRFFTVEHIAIMLIAIIIATVGNAMAKRNPDPVVKHKKVAIFFLIALVLILISIPWPFMQPGEGRGWL